MALKPLPASLFTATQPKTTDPGLVPDKSATGIFGDLFDIISRPSSAVQTGIRYGLDSNPGTSFVQGLGEGLTGKTHTSAAQTLKEHGVGGPLGAVAGFAGDVLLDPLTYLGVKVSKGISADEALLTAIKSSAKDVDLEAANLLAKNPTRVGLTVAGKPFGKGFAVGDVGGRVVEKLLGPATDRGTVGKLFSRNAELPLGLNNMQRVVENSNNSLFNDFRTGIKNVFMGDLTPEERVAIAKAIEKGDTLHNVPTTQANARLANLGAYQELALKVQNDAFLREAELGLHPLKKGADPKLVTSYEDYNSNYLYKYFEKPPKDLTPEMRRGISISDAEAAGYKPVTDIHDLLDLRMAKHYRDVTKATFARDAIDQFGIPADKLDALSDTSELHKFGWTSVDKLKNPVAKLHEGKVLPEFVVKALNTAEGVFSQPSVANDVMKGYDKFLNNWKFLNASMPGQHIRNGFGDYIMNLADGVKNPARYAQAMKVIKGVEEHNANSLLQLVDESAAHVPPVTGGKIKIGDKMYTSGEVWDMFGQSGAKSGYITSELQRSLNSSEKSALHNYASKVKSVVGDVADKREDVFRMAHFIDALDKHVGSGVALEEAVQKAGAQVRKFNIDYGNLSSFEKDVARRVIPFYTYMRKATPLNMELLFTKPGFMALYPKGKNLAEGLLGTTDENGNPIIPSWITDMAPIRVARANEQSRNPIERLLATLAGAGNNEPAFLSTTTGTTPFDTLKLPLEPVQKLMQGDITGALRSPVSNITQGLTPAIKAPVEVTTGRNMFTDQKITDWPSWMINQIGPGRAVTKGMNQSVPNSLTSNLLGLPLQVATVQRQAGEFYNRQAAASAKAHELKVNTLRKRFPDWESYSPARQRRLMAGARVPTVVDPALKAQQRYVQETLGQ